MDNHIPIYESQVYLSLKYFTYELNILWAAYVYGALEEELLVGNIEMIWDSKNNRQNLEIIKKFHGTFIF